MRTVLAGGAMKAAAGAVTMGEYNFARCAPQVTAVAAPRTTRTARTRARIVV